MQGPVEISVCPHWVIARHDYQGAPEDDELSFQTDDKITVLKRDTSGWWQGELNDEVGWFPKTFVQPFQSSVGIALPDGEDLRLVCGQTRAVGVLNQAGDKIKFSVDYVPQGAWLECSDAKTHCEFDWKSGLKPFRRLEGITSSSEPLIHMPPRDVLCLIFKMCPGSHAALSLTCREFRRAAASMSHVTLNWTFRDEVRTLEGAFHLLREAPWFIGPQIAEQAESLLQRFECSPIAVACVLHSVRITDLDELTDDEINLLDRYCQVGESGDSSDKQKVGTYAAQTDDPGMAQAWLLLRF